MRWQSSSPNSTLQRSVQVFNYTRYQNFLQHASPFSTFTGTARSNLQVKFIERTHSSETYDSSPSGSSPLQNTLKQPKASRGKNKFSNNIKIFNNSNNLTVTDQTPDINSTFQSKCPSYEVAEIFAKTEKDKALEDLLVNVQNQFLTRRLSYL